MAIINFSGVVVDAVLSEKSIPSLIICCVSRIDSKNWGIISLDGEFTEELPDLKLEAGCFVCGKADIQYIWDGTIYVEFLKDGFQTMPPNSITDFKGNILKDVYSPRSKRQILSAAKQFHAHRYDTNFYSHQLNWKQWPFARLGLNLLSDYGDSMASLEGNAMFIGKITLEKLKKPRKWWEPLLMFVTANFRRKRKINRIKFNIFLLSLSYNKRHTPIFMLCMDSHERLTRGEIYHFKNLPILQNNDTAPVAPAAECESTLFCANGNFNHVENPDPKLLAWLYDELGNMAMMPSWLWNKYFGGKLERDFPLAQMAIIKEKLKEYGVEPAQKVHGWWYFWYGMTSVGESEPEEVEILAPDFRDGGPARVIILPVNLYNIYTFPEHGSAVSVSKKPEIIEGTYKPDARTWELVKKWIIANEEALKGDTLLWGDLKFSEKDQE